MISQIAVYLILQIERLVAVEIDRHRNFQARRFAVVHDYSLPIWEVVDDTIVPYACRSQKLLGLRHAPILAGC